MLAIKTVAEGKAYFCHDAMCAAMRVHAESFVAGQKSRARFLTAREQDVIKLAASGLTGKELSAELGISPNTAKTHIRRIKQKTRCRNIAELVRYALEAKLI